MKFRDLGSEWVQVKVRIRLGLVLPVRLGVEFGFESLEPLGSECGVTVRIGVTVKAKF